MKIFHLIDKGNGAEAKYELGGQSRTHGWIPKLSCRLFNTNFNNSFRIALPLIEKHNPGRRPVTISEGIKEATRALLQRGNNMRTQAPDHPSPVRDTTSVCDTGCGKRKRLDPKGIITTTPKAVPVESVSTKAYKLRNQQKKTPMANVSVCTSYTRSEG